MSKINDPMRFGNLTREWTAWCYRCEPLDVSCTVAANSKTNAKQMLEAAGWHWGDYCGWVCPACVKKEEEQDAN